MSADLLTPRLDTLAKWRLYVAAVVFFGSTSARIAMELHDRRRKGA